MPTYQYACTDCGDKSEVVQRFTDEALTVCAVCGGKLRKVFSPVGIVFKGSGFYRTDSRDSSRAVPASANGSNGSDKSGSDKNGSDKSGSAATSESGSSKTSESSSGDKGSKKASSVGASSTGSSSTTS